MRKKRKQKNQAFVIITGVLFGLILFLLAGNLYLKQDLQRVIEKKAELKREKEEYAKAADSLEALGEELQENLKLERKALKEKQRLLTLASTEEEAEKEEAKRKEAEEQEEAEEENAAAQSIDGIQEAVSSRISGRSGENWGVYVCRLKDGAKESIGQGRMVAASLIKLYIMGAVYADYDNLTSVQGKEKIDSLLYSMITVSDNDASNTLTKMLGGGDAKAGREAVTAYCVKNGYADSSMGRMLLETNTDRENYTSAQDCGRFLERVYNGQTDHAQDMLELLKKQQRTGKIPAGVPAGVETANKTGELANVENDAAIVWAQGSPYILCVMSEQLADTAAARQIIVNISSDVYNKMNEP